MTSPLRNFSLTNADGTMKSAAELQADADRLIADAQARGERMRSQLADNVVEATSRNQAATVVVTATGALQGLRLSERAKDLTPTLIAASVMEAYHDATRRAAARTAEIADQESGDQRIVGLVRALIPEQAEADRDKQG